MTENRHCPERRLLGPLERGGWWLLCPQPAGGAGLGPARPTRAHREIFLCRASSASFPSKEVFVANERFSTQNEH